MELQTPKSRWQESEWWLTIGTILLGILVKTGIINPAHSEMAADIMNDVISLVLVVAPVLGWQFTRTKKKIAERDQDAKVAEAKIAGTAKVRAVRQAVPVVQPECPEPPAEETRRTLDPPKIS